MSQRVLVRGATGFIGGRLAHALAASGRRVRCLVRGRGDRPYSRHLRSRHETALLLREHGPPLLGSPHRPRIPVPLITPWLSWLWIGLVTPVDAVARPLIEGPGVPTVVADASGMDRFEIQPVSFDEALRRAVAEAAELRHLAAAPAGAS